MWNNILENGLFSNDAEGWSKIRSTANLSNNELTLTRTATGSLPFGLFINTDSIIVNGHKYYTKIDGRIDVENSVVVLGFYQSNYSAGTAGGNITSESTTFTEITGIISGTDTTAAFGIKSGYVSSASNATVIIKNCMLVDLTLMFGAGNEPETVEEVEKIIKQLWMDNPQGMYTYNAEGTTMYYYDY